MGMGHAVMGARAERERLDDAHDHDVGIASIIGITSHDRLY
jgi:hypothetical protein